MSVRNCFTLCIAVLGLSAFAVNCRVFAQGPNLHGLYVPPSNSFIEDPTETRIRLNFGTLPLSQIQSQLDSTRASDPNSPIVLTMTGTYLITDTPLMLPSHTSLVLYGSMLALPGATASSLISIVGQTDVAISGGLLEGAGAAVAGIDAESSTKINIDAVTITNIGRDGIILNGRGNTSTDSGSAITRCEVSFARGNGITVGSTTQALVLDNLVRDNKGAGVQVGAAFSSVVNNVSRNNNVGIDVDANDNLISDNEVRRNPSAGILLKTTSANTVVMRNVVAGNSQVGIDLDGTNNLVYDNLLDNPLDLTDRVAGNWVLPRGASLAAPMSNYFFPPTIDNQHAEAIMNGMGRTDLTLSSTTITAVQQAYDAAVQENPKNVVVLHLNGAFTVDAAPLTLASNTAVILNGTISNDSSTAVNLITAKNPVEFISFSGGAVDCGGKVMEPIAFTSQTMANLDQITLQNCGTPNRTNNGMVHLVGGTGYNIIHANSFNGTAGRGIWTQNPTSRFIVLENHMSNTGADGVDFDSSTSYSVAASNVSVDNLRNGVFVEQSASFDKIYANSATTRGLDASTGRGVGLTNNATSASTRNVCDSNVLFSNSSDTIRNGLAVNSGASVAGGIAETAHTFAFNNVIINSTAVGLSIAPQFPRSVENYFSQTVLSDNNPDLSLSASNGATPPEFFNPPSVVNLALHRPITASSSASNSSPDAAVDGLSFTSWTAAEQDRSSSLTIDLGSEMSFRRVVLKTTVPFALRMVTLQTSQDGITFKDIPGSARIELFRVDNITFAPVSARFLRVRIDTLLGGSASYEEVSIQPN